MSTAAMVKCTLWMQVWECNLRKGLLFSYQLEMTKDGLYVADIPKKRKKGVIIKSVRPSLLSYYAIHVQEDVEESTADDRSSDRMRVN